MADKQSRKRGDKAKAVAEPAGAGAGETALAPRKVEGELIEPVDDSVIDAVYDEIRVLHHEATVAVAARVGKLLVDRFFGGSVERARATGAKDSSLRRLADKFEADGIRGSSLSALSRAISIFELDDRIGVATMQRLGATHVQAVLGLSDQERQRELLARADQESWSVQRLREEVAAVREPAAGQKRGRKPQPAFLKTAAQLTKLVAKKNAFGELDKLDGLPRERVAAAHEGIKKMREQLAELEAALERRLGGES